MSVQKIFKAENNLAIYLSNSAVKALDLKKGDRLSSKTLQKGNILISKKLPKKEFQKWLDTFLKENGKLLDELASR